MRPPGAPAARPAQPRPRARRTGLSRLALLVAALVVATAGARPAAGGRPGDPKQEAVRVVVHPATPVQVLSREEVSRLFLRKVARWADGRPVQPVDQRDGTPARDAFSRAVHRRSAGMMREYWQRQVFSGRQIPPPEDESDAAVLAFVRATPGAIGYVSAAADLQGVRVLTVVPD